MILDIHIDSNPRLSVGDANLVSVLSGLRAVEAVVPLTRFYLQRTAPHVYTYRFNAVDGRIWRQTMTFSPDAQNPSMTFNQVTGAWLLTEFIPHRAVREACGRLVNAVDLTMLDITFG